jgi:hypothetical protein
MLRRWLRLRRRLRITPCGWEIVATFPAPAEFVRCGFIWYGFDGCRLAATRWLAGNECTAGNDFAPGDECAAATSAPPQ